MSIVFQIGNYELAPILLFTEKYVTFNSNFNFNIYLLYRFYFFSFSKLFIGHYFKEQVANPNKSQFLSYVMYNKLF